MDDLQDSTGHPALLSSRILTYSNFCKFMKIPQVCRLVAVSLLGPAVDKPRLRKKEIPRGNERPLAACLSLALADSCELDVKFKFNPKREAISLTRFL